MNEMDSKTRLLNAMRGKEIDQIPWSPFLAYYWDFLDKDIRDAGMVQYYKDMGADPLLRGTVALHSIHWDKCDIRQEVKGNKRNTIYETAVGNLVETYTYSSAANSWFLTGHPLKEEKDFKTLMYLFEHIKIEDKLKEFEKEYMDLGEQGLILPVLGIGAKTAFQSLVEHWCGTEELAYALCDYSELVEDCLQVMMEKDKKTVEIALKSSAEGFIFWEDSSTTNISPAFFESYALPQIDDWGGMLHEEGRLLVHHACGHLRDLIPIIGRSSIDVLESISPPPTGNITPKEIRELLPDKIGLIGGIEPTFLLNSTLQELLEHVEKLLDSMEGSRYILGNSDSCPPGVEYEKFTAISHLVKGNRV